MIDDDRAVSAIIDFIVGMGVFVVLLALFFVFSPIATQTNPGSTRQAVAESTLDSLITRPGLANGSGTEWHKAPEEIGVLGLRAGRSDHLHFRKIAVMAHGERTNDPSNEALDYPSARWALGLTRLDPSFHFRLRIQPQVRTNASTHDTDLLEDARVAYVGTKGAETDMIDETAVRFDDETQQTPGDDIFADDVAGVDELISDLPAYQIVVVGSGADHSPLDRPTVRDEIASWVASGAGLVVLGSNQADASWLADTLDSPGHGAQTGDVEIVNETGALRTLPHLLAVDEYDPVPSGAGFAAWTTDSRVVRLAVAEDAPLKFTLGHGFVANGTVVLTTYQPSDVESDVGSKEARRFVANLLHLAGTGPINLDHGIPPIQESRSSTATRGVVVNHPRIGTIRARVALTLWGG